MRELAAINGYRLQLRDRRETELSATARVRLDAMLARENAEHERVVALDQQQNKVLAEYLSRRYRRWRDRQPERNFHVPLWLAKLLIRLKLGYYN